MGLKPKERKEKLNQFCEKYIPNYNKAKFFKLINRALNHSLKKTNKLIDILELPVYKSEIEWINNLDYPDDFKKVIFTFLVQKRLDKTVFEFLTEKPYINEYFKGGSSKYNDIKKSSNIKGSISLNDDVVYCLAKDGYIDILCKGSIKLKFLSMMPPPDVTAITLTRFENIGYYLDWYNKNDKVVLCAGCGAALKKKSNNHIYCKECATPEKLCTKKIVCIDCGTEVEVDAKDNSTERCEGCYDSYRREYKRINERKRRKNLNNTICGQHK